MSAKQHADLMAVMVAIRGEAEETNRLLTMLIAQNVPVYPTPAELGLVMEDED